MWVSMNLAAYIVPLCNFSGEIRVVEICRQACAPVKQNHIALMNAIGEDNWRFSGMN
jgi:hypothetical protein